MNITECQNCSKPLKETASFCGKCKTQVKCLNCKEAIAPDDECCENCGTDISKRNGNTGVLNKIRFQENSEGRFFEAEFTDEVGKDLTGTLGEILTARQLALGGFEKPISTAENNFETPTTGNRDEKTVDVSFEDASEAIQKDSNYPSLQSVVMKNLPANEAEWIIVYSFYSSNFGSEIFTRQNILDMYGETNRRTESRTKNFSQYLKTVVKSNSINPINNKGEFSLLDKGKERAIEIIQRTSSSPVKSTKTTASAKEVAVKSNTSKKSTPKGKSNALTLVNTINFHPKDAENLKDFYSKLDTKSNFEKNLVFVYYLKEVLKLSDIGVNHIYTCYKHVGERVPGNLYQSLLDTNKHKAWIDTSNLSQISVAVPGENYFEHDLKRK